MADTPVPTDLDTAQETARELIDEAGAHLSDAGEVTAERLEEARALLAERLGEAREVITDRARTHGPELAAWARSTGADLAERAGPVISERTAQARTEAARRWHELEDELPVEVDAQQVGRQLERGLWQVISASLSILLLVPKLLVRGLGALGDLADDVADRGVVVGERAREAAAAVPPSRRERRRRAARTAAWTGAGFGFGLLVGWLVGRRDDTTVTYEPADLGAHLSPSVDPEPVPPAADTGAGAGATAEVEGASVDDQDASGEDQDASDDDEDRG